LDRIPGTGSVSACAELLPQLEQRDHESRQMVSSVKKTGIIRYMDHDLRQKVSLFKNKGIISKERTDHEQEKKDLC